MPANKLEEVLLKMRFQENYVLVLHDCLEEEMEFYYQLEELGYVFVNHSQNVDLIVVGLTEFGLKVVNAICKSPHDN